MAYTRLFTKQLVDRPDLEITYYYEKKRDGADMKYRFKTELSTITGQSYFGYAVYLDYIKLDGETYKKDYTIKSSNPNRWEDEIVDYYPSKDGWYTVKNKVSGTTSFSTRLSSNGGFSSKSQSSSLTVDPAKTIVNSLEIGKYDGIYGWNYKFTMNTTCYNSSFNHKVELRAGSLNGTLIAERTNISFDKGKNIYILYLSQQEQETMLDTIPNTTKIKVFAKIFTTNISNSSSEYITKTFELELASSYVFGEIKQTNQNLLNTVGADNYANGFNTINLSGVYANPSYGAGIKKYDVIINNEIIETFSPNEGFIMSADIQNVGLKNLPPSINLSGVDDSVDYIGVVATDTRGITGSLIRPVEMIFRNYYGINLVSSNLERSSNDEEKVNIGFQFKISDLKRFDTETVHFNTVQNVQIGYAESTSGEIPELPSYTFVSVTSSISTTTEHDNNYGNDNFICTLSSLELLNTFDKDKNYHFILKVQDKLQDNYADIGFIYSTTPIYHKTKDGLAIGDRFDSSLNACLQLYGQNANVALNGVIMSSPNLFPVGAVYITSTNTNPSSYLGGQWTLIDKEFRNERDTGSNLFTINSTNAQAPTINVTRAGHSLRIRFTFENKVRLADTEVEIGNFNYTNMGCSTIVNSLTDIVGATDAGDAVLNGTINYSTGKIIVGDIVHKTGQSYVEVGKTCYFDFNIPLVYDIMLDSFCDKFYWKRTS